VLGCRQGLWGSSLLTATGSGGSGPARHLSRWGQHRIARYLVTVTAAELPTLPAASYALHISVCVPLPDFAVFHFVVKAPEVDVDVKAPSR
jgi:hypothetical protein